MPSRLADAIDPSLKQALSSADVLIYQPLAPAWGAYSTHSVGSTASGEPVEGLLAHCHKDCLLLSFPYIYNDALWPMFKEGERWKTIEPLLPFFTSGLGVGDVLSIYRHGGIDFRYAERMQRSLQILGNRDAECSIRVFPYIAHRLSSERLFRAQNHPSFDLLIYLACRFFEAIGIDISIDRVASLRLRATEIMSDMPGYYPMEATAIRALPILSPALEEESLAETSRAYWEATISSAYTDLLATKD